MCVVNFCSLTACDPDRFGPGLQRSPSPKIECVEDLTEILKLVHSGHSFVRSCACSQAELLLHQWLFSYCGNQTKKKVATGGISMVYQSFMTIEDAAGVLCPKYD
jgi:hypothetical protein